ncbi:MAG: RNA methyltransferase [Patescibacteria group bacterium]|nr:RNA methyltransferase [Patescibacteria group bacterium]
MKIITSSKNIKIKEINKLRKSNKRKKENLFIIEGKKEIDLAKKSGICVKELFFLENVYGEELNSFSGITKNSVADEVFKKISFRENPDGYLAIAQSKNFQLKNIKLSKNPFLLILEAIEKPGNLGAILRSADAAGIDAVIITEPKTDIFNPNVIRSGLGTIFTNQIAICKNKELFSWLKEKNINTFAATPNTDNFYCGSNFKNSLALVIGAEHEGLSKEWLEFADNKIKIPMNGKIDSLNASASAAIILFEVVRQRKPRNNLKKTAI